MGFRDPAYGELDRGGTLGFLQSGIRTTGRCVKSCPAHLQAPRNSLWREAKDQPRNSRALEEFGQVVERLMALGCKPSDLRVYGGSNPPLSTMLLKSERE